MQRRRRGLGNGDDKRKREPPPQLGPRKGVPPGVPGFKGLKTCNMSKLEAKIATLHRECRPKKRFKPLFEHLIVLARSSAEHGYCTRAGQELRHAKKVAGY